MRCCIGKYLNGKVIIAVIFLGVLAVIACFSIHSMNHSLLENAQTMGTEIASRVSLAEENAIMLYEQVVMFGAQGLYEQLRSGASFDAMHLWMKYFVEYMQETLKLSNLEIYAAIDDKILGLTPWEGDSTFDVQNAFWYKLAIENPGKTMFTDAYTDVRTEETAITLVRKLPCSDTVFALNLYTKYLKNWPQIDSAPQGTSYYFCDSKGNLLCSNLTNSVDASVLQRELADVFREINSDPYKDSQLFFVDELGIKRGVYYHRASNGWLSIITIPRDALLEGLEGVTSMFIALIVSGLVIVFVLMILNRISEGKAELYNRITRVLGHSYFALYLIDIQNGVYRMLKASDYVRNHASAEGRYSVLQDVLAANLQPGTELADFYQNLSLENIQRLASRRIHDYSIDIKQLFNGEYRWIQFQMLYSESLPGHEVVLAVKEVNAVKEAALIQQQLLNDTVTQLQEESRAKQAFFSSMSHDMRTPLNVILGLVDLAGKYICDRVKMTDYLDKIRIASNQLLELINDILEMARIEQGGESVSRCEFSLQQKVEELVSVFVLLADQQEKIFNVTLEISDNTVIGDSFKVQQILNNLLSNAFKYTRKGDTVTLTVTKIPDVRNKFPKYEFIIRDTGYGMSAEYLEKLFTPFERENRESMRHIKGTGLGMPIVRNAVVKMNGQISVESKIDEGSCFMVILPFEQGGEEVIQPEEKTGEIPQLEMAGKHILLAEDNEINMEISCEVLEQNGFIVSKAWNGKEAVDIFAASTVNYFDAILLDMQMDVMDGCTAASHIRKLNREDASTVPIIAVTANTYLEDIARTREAGMNAHVSKPIDFTVLKKTMRDLILVHGKS